MAVLNQPACNNVK